MSWRNGVQIVATLLFPTVLLAQQEPEQPKPRVIAPDPGVRDHILSVRGVSPLAAWRLSPSLGIDEHAFARVGRGVYARDVRIGTGAVVDSGTVATVHYVGRLANGAVFDSSERGPFSFELGAGQVIPGWDDGVLGMRVGGQRQLVIPPHLGYGPAGAGPIPPDAVLIFDVQVVDARRR